MLHHDSYDHLKIILIGTCLNSQNKNIKYFLTTSCHRQYINIDINCGVFFCFLFLPMQILINIKKNCIQIAKLWREVAMSPHPYPNLWKLSHFS